MTQLKQKIQYDPPAIRITQDAVERFISQQRRKSLAKDTISRYVWGLQKFQAYLAPTGGMIKLGTLENWQKALRESGYSTATINMNISIANSLLEFLRRGDLKAEPLPSDAKQGPQITREEYLRLLQTARIVKKRHAYLLIKLFGTVPLSVSDLDAVTVEAVQTGQMQVMRGKTPELLYVPAVLAEELLTYAQSQGIHEGLIFRSRVGTLYSRSSVTQEMQKIAEDAHILPEKATPRALKKLCRKTLNEIDEKLRAVALQNYEMLLCGEQRTIGWQDV